MLQVGSPCLFLTCQNLFFFWRWQAMTCSLQHKNTADDYKLTEGQHLASVLPCIALYCPVLPCIALYPAVLSCIALYVSPCIALPQTFLTASQQLRLVSLSPSSIKQWMKHVSELMLWKDSAGSQGLQTVNNMQKHKNDCDDHDIFVATNLHQSTCAMCDVKSMWHVCAIWYIVCFRRIVMDVVHEKGNRKRSVAY